MVLAPQRECVENIPGTQRVGDGPARGGSATRARPAAPRDQTRVSPVASEAMFPPLRQLRAVAGVLRAHPDSNKWRPTCGGRVTMSSKSLRRPGLGLPWRRRPRGSTRAGSQPPARQPDVRDRHPGRRTHRSWPVAPSRLARSPSCTRATGRRSSRQRRPRRSGPVTQMVSPAPRAQHRLTVSRAGDGHRHEQLRRAGEIAPPPHGSRRQWLLP